MALHQPATRDGLRWVITRNPIETYGDAYDKIFNMRNFLGVLFSLLFAPWCRASPSMPLGCWSDTVHVIEDNGTSLATDSGRTFQFLGQDYIDPNTWRKSDPIMICPLPNKSPSDTKKLFKIESPRLHEKLVVIELNAAKQH